MDAPFLMNNVVSSARPIAVMFSTSAMDDARVLVTVLGLERRSMPSSTLFTRTIGKNGIICSSSTNGWSASVSANSNWVPAGTLSPPLARARRVSPM